MVSVVVFSEDEALVAQIREATNMLVHTHTELAKSEVKVLLYEYIVLVDTKTLTFNFASDVLRKKSRKPIRQIILLEHGNSIQNDLPENISDIWYTPISTDVLRTRLNDIEIALDEQKLLGQYASFLGFETKNLLSSTKGYAEVLLSGKLSPELTEQQEKFIQIMRNNTLKIEQLIYDAYDYALIESDRFEIDMKRVRFEDVLNEILKPDRTPTHYEIGSSFPEFHAEFPENIPDLLTEKKRLIKLFDMVILNAFKSPKPVLIKADILNEYVEFQVINFGENPYRVDGSAPNKILFQSIYISGKLIEHIIKAHGGEMWLEQDNDSSTFHFTIPIAKENASDGE